MADQPTLHIDTDWKKQAQEEKRKLAEQEQKRATAAAPTASAVAEGAGSAKAAGTRREGRDQPVASFARMVESFATQAIYYLGGLAMQGAEPVVNLDLAKYHLDSLVLLEEKTKNNLTELEKKSLDEALYEVQMRYVAIASEYI